MRELSRGGFVLLAATVVALLLPSVAGAQDSGSTMTPDRRSFLVNKDFEDERWTINLNLYAPNPAAIISITGNIFRRDGGDPQFVACLVRDDSRGDLTDPRTVFRLACSVADSCATTAEQCAREGWVLVDDDIRVPTSFFLPPDGFGPAQAEASRRSFLERLVARLAGALDHVRLAVTRRGLELAGPRRAHAQAAVRGATLTFDRLNHLVTKDLGPERWSISYSYTPVITGRGVQNRFLSVTGNVFQADGSPPAFVYCEPQPDSTGTLDDPSSEFRFLCLGTDACETTAEECAEEWTLISDDVRVPASFFLPPLGLPAAPQSDPDVVVIGRTSDPPSIGAAEFTTANGASVAAAGVAGGCPLGDECIIETLGGCDDVVGEVRLIEDFGCACVVDEVPPSCIACAGGRSGQCGTECEYPVASSTARGTCLPFDSEEQGCICFANPAGGALQVPGCAGVLEAPCSGDRCCTNDPRGSCDPLGGIVSCPGVCVSADGCNPDVEQCGICFPPAGVTPTPTPTPTSAPTATPTPTVGPTPSGSPTATPEPTPTPTATPEPTPSPSPTPTPQQICRGIGQSCDPQSGPPCCPGLRCSGSAAGVCVPN